MEKEKIGRIVCVAFLAILLYGCVLPILSGEKLGTDWMYRDVIYDIEPTSLEGERVPPEEEPLVSEQIRRDRGVVKLQFQNAEPEIWRLDHGGEEYLLAPETGMLFLPDWEEREEPCLHLTDVQKPYIGLSMLGIIGEGESLYYVQAREHHRLSLWGAAHASLTLFPITYTLEYRKFDFGTGEVSQVTETEYMAVYERLWQETKI